MENKLMTSADRYLVHTYNKYPIVVERGEGVYVYDTEGKKYLDFAAGIAVSSLGYHNEEYNQALKDQVDKLIHISNLYYNETVGKAAESLARVSGMDQVFFTNSGTEAIEGALKAARKYAYRKGTGRYEYIAMNHSFHGRSMGAVAVTGKEAYRTPFEPLVQGVKFAEFNDLESVKAQVTDKTCAIIMEPLQGEGGIYPAAKEFVEGVRKLCDEEGILLIFDEIQCGMGRTGYMFSWQEYGARPDILAMAKAIGNGVPVGAFALTDAVAGYSLEPGDHGSTYGGGPLVCAAVAKTIEIFERENLAEHAKKVGAYLEQKLEEITQEFDCVAGHRGKGLMQGLIVKEAPGEIVKKAMKEGLLLIVAGTDVIRIVPPLIVTEEHVDEMTEKLRKALS